jgi:peptidylprolyl isomerase
MINIVRKKRNKKEKNSYLKKAIVMIGLLIVIIFGAIFVMQVLNKMNSNNDIKVLVETTMGNFTLKLYSDMPVTTGNFEKLVRDGFYDGIIFHRIIKDFMIQGGDPTGTGMGGPGYKIKDEFVAGHSNLRGTISMANAGPNTGGSQFFINLVDNTYLDYDKPPFTSKHPVFGEIIEGMDTIDSIGSVKVNSQDKPLEDVKIIKASIIE